jgi:DNA-binding transcriptional regulator YiaG
MGKLKEWSEYCSAPLGKGGPEFTGGWACFQMTEPRCVSSGTETGAAGKNTKRNARTSGGKRTKVEAKSHIVRVRLKSGLSQTEFVAALGVSKRTLEYWEQDVVMPAHADAK